MWRSEKDVRSKGAVKHLEKLEKEQSKSKQRDPMLDAHLRRLKIGWGRACAGPDQIAS